MHHKQQMFADRMESSPGLLRCPMFRARVEVLGYSRQGVHCWQAQPSLVQQQGSVPTSASRTATVSCSRLYLRPPCWTAPLLATCSSSRLRSLTLPMELPPGPLLVWPPPQPPLRAALPAALPGAAAWVLALGAARPARRLCPPLVLWQVFRPILSHHWLADAAAGCCANRPGVSMRPQPLEGRSRRCEQLALLLTCGSLGPRVLLLAKPLLHIISLLPLLPSLPPLLFSLR